MRHGNADGLGAVDRAAATNGDNDVAACSPVHLGTMHDLFGARIGRDLGEQDIVETLLHQALLNIDYPTGGLHSRVRYQQHLAGTESRGVIGDGLARSCAKNDLGRDKLAQLADIVGHALASALLL